MRESCAAILQWQFKPKRKIGLLLAQGKTLQRAVDSLGHVAEGVYCARAVVQRALS